MTDPHPLDAPIVGVLRGATLPDGRVVDVQLDGPVVREVLPAGTAPAPIPGTIELDLAGHLLLTAPADPHAHLDKARSWDAIRPPMGDLERAIDSWRAYAATMPVADVSRRAREQALAMLANGTTAVRSHVDLLPGPEPLRCVEALVAVREELADLVDLELVALAGPECPDTVIEAALDAGLDAVGGAPHLADDPLADLRRLLAIAERRGVAVDLHTDEALAGEPTLAEYARITTGWSQNRSAGHCVRLGTLPALERDAQIAAAVDAGIGIIANPITNLYLQGWEHPESTPRGLTAARAVLEAGGRFAAGADNVRDPFNPLGRSDALETAALLVAAAHLTVDEAYHAVSEGAREVLALPAAGARPGARAEFLAVRAASLAEAVAEAPAERLVVHGGRLVARTTVRREVASPARRPRAAEEIGSR
ncbi:MAG: hypothetical protein J0G30_06160 [Actinomycetales bacterium]|nr:hypothetical protein [Actinomycetales bacterium]